MFIFELFRIGNMNITVELMVSRISPISKVHYYPLKTQPSTFTIHHVYRIELVNILIFILSLLLPLKVTKPHGNTRVRQSHWNRRWPFSVVHFNQIVPISGWCTWRIVAIVHFRPLVMYWSEWKILFQNWLPLGESIQHSSLIWLNEKFSCVISTMCVPNLEFQLVNPTTQVALFALCLGSCPTTPNIIWNIYEGETNSSTNFTRWIRFNQTDQYRNIWFFGKFPRPIV